MSNSKLPRELIIEAVEILLNRISPSNGYYTSYPRIDYSNDLPAEYGTNLLVWRDGKGEGQYGSNQPCKLWFEVDAVLVETTDKPAHAWGTLALADLEKAFKTIGASGAISTKFKSDKWVETKGKTVARVFFTVCVEYRNK